MAPIIPEPLGRRPFRRIGNIIASWREEEARYRELRASLCKKKYTAIVMRYPIASRPLVKFLRTCGLPVFFEHNTKEIDELRLKAKQSFSCRRAYTRELRFGRGARLQASGLIAVTPEIAEHERQRAGTSNIPTQIITNGVDTRRMPIRNAPCFDGKELRLIMLCSSPSAWHGEDRLIRGMAHYQGCMDVRHLLVCEYLETTKHMVKELSVQHCVQFHPPVGGRDLSKLIDGCHIAVAPLAIHRKGLSQATPLKTREYLARGIPFIYGYYDPDLEKHQAMKQFACHVPLSEEPIDVGSLVDFFRSVCSDARHPTDMRAMAEDLIDSRRKAEELLAFVRSLA